MHRLMPLRHHLWALLGLGALTLLFTYPLVAHLNTHVIGPLRSDNFEYVWKMWWVPHALFEAQISPFFAPHIYVPFGYPLAYGELTPTHTFLMLPVTLLLGEVAAYNLAILGSTLVTGWAAYALARRWLERLTPNADSRLLWISALFAGAAFAFSAFRMTRFEGQMPLLDTQWVVLALLLLDRWLESSHLRDAALLGLCLALAALSSWYFAFMLALMLPIYVLAHRGRALIALLREWRTWRALGVAVAIVVGLCAPFLLPYLELSREGATVVPARDASFWAASPVDYVMPNPLHPLWGSAVRGLVWPFPTPYLSEFNHSLGWVTLLLGLWAWRRARGAHWRGLKWMIAAAFVLSLGTELHIGRLPLGVPLPAALVREFMPFADSIRTWGRFSMFVALGVALLAGAGLLLTLTNQPARRSRVLGALALGVMLFAGWHGPLELVAVEPRPVDGWLAEQPDEAPIMEYPLGVALSGPSMLYTRYHGKPVVFGYGTYLPLIYRQRHPELITFPNDAALDQLAEWDVRYVLVTMSELGAEAFTLADVDAQPRLKNVGVFADVRVYELSD